MTRCASPLSNFPPKGERAIASSPACGRGLHPQGVGRGCKADKSTTTAHRKGFAMGAGMAAMHLLPQSVDITCGSPIYRVNGIELSRNELRSHKGLQ